MGVDYYAKRRFKDVFKKKFRIFDRGAQAFCIRRHRIRCSLSRLRSKLKNRVAQWLGVQREAVPTAMTTPLRQARRLSHTSDSQPRVQRRNSSAGRSGIPMAASRVGSTPPFNVHYLDAKRLQTTVNRTGNTQPTYDFLTSAGASPPRPLRQTFRQSQAVKPGNAPLPPSHISIC